MAAGAESVSRAERTGLLGVSAPDGEAALKETSKSQSGGNAADKHAEAGKRHPALRALLWTLRKSIVPALFVVALIGGLYVGYTVLGKKPGEDVFEWHTWKHMYDLVFADS